MKILGIVTDSENTSNFNIDEFLEELDDFFLESLESTSELKVSHFLDSVNLFHLDIELPYNPKIFNSFIAFLEGLDLYFHKEVPE